MMKGKNQLGVGRRRIGDGKSRLLRFIGMLEVARSHAKNRRSPLKLNQFDVCSFENEEVLRRIPG